MKKGGINVMKADDANPMPLVNVMQVCSLTHECK